MKFRLAAFWLFLLTVGGNHKQLSHDCARGMAMAVAPTEQRRHKGNELENALKLRETSKQTRFIGDITTTIHPDNATATASAALATSTVASAGSRSIGHHALRRAKASSSSSTSQDLELHFRETVAQLFASDETPNGVASDNPAAASLATDPSRGEPTTTHHPGRRHVMPDKLQYTKEIQVKQGRLMGITRRFQVTSGLGEVDQYLGLPYAEAPTGSRRFMPPGEFRRLKH